MAPNFKKEELKFPFFEARTVLKRSGSLCSASFVKMSTNPTGSLTWKKLSFNWNIMVFIGNKIIPNKNEYEPTAMFRIRIGS
jgi:hypothetical protein